MDLADKVIQANEQEIVEKEANDSAPEGFYTDDLGFWVEQDIRRHKIKFAEYVLFRCKYLNDELNVRNATMLFNGNVLVRKNSLDIASLADLPEAIPNPIAIWVYKRLFDDAPRLDRSKIEIAPGWIWDMDKCAIIKTERRENGH